MNRRTLIITSTLKPTANDIKHFSFDKRLDETISALLVYIKSGLYKRLVFADNSNQSIYHLIRDQIVEHDMQYNEVVFNTDKELYESHGGYKCVGEYDTLSKVLYNIEFLDGEILVKISGRYIIRNHNIYFDKYNCINTAFCLFYPAFIKRDVYTSFYITNPEHLAFLINHYLDYEKKIGYESPIPIERVFGNILFDCFGVKKLQRMPSPLIVGLSGTTGRDFTIPDWRSRLQKVYSAAFGSWYGFDLATNQNR